MCAIFFKEVASSVVCNKLLKLNKKYIGKEEYILEIDINSSKLKKVSRALKNNLTSKDIVKKLTLKDRLNRLREEIVLNKFKHALRTVIKRNNLCNYLSVFSIDLKKKKVASYVNEILEDLGIKEYTYENTMELNFEKYIEEYMKKNNLEPQKIVPVILVNDINKLNFNIIERLNNKYKELGIFCMGKMTKDFQKRIKNINDETGSCVQILDNKIRDFKLYNVCILIDVSRESVFKYKFNKKTCYIDFVNKENDKYNENYLKLEEYIEKGKYDVASIKELYSEYGKVTLSNVIMDM